MAVPSPTLHDELSLIAQQLPLPVNTPVSAGVFTNRGKASPS